VKLKQWSAGDACLCTPDTQDPASVGSGSSPAGSAASYARGGLGILTSSSKSVPGSLVPAHGLSAGVFTASSSGAWSVRSSFVGWGNGARFVSAYSASGGGGGSAALGGMWRLMGFGHRNRTASSSPTPKVSSNNRSSRGNGNGNGHGGGGGSTQPPAVGTIVPTPSPIGDLFGEQTRTIIELLCGVPPAPGLGNTGGPGHIGSGGSLAHTPEPASLLLLGTGALGLFGMLRRRQAQ
jgi:hypothetical protein